MDRVRAAVLGGTGLVGQRFIQLLDGHPFIEVTHITGRSSVGKLYGEAVDWRMEGSIPEWARETRVSPSDPELLAREGVEVAFSALPASIAADIEVELAKRGVDVASNARPMRMEPDVPLLNGEVNHSHVRLARLQGETRGWRGVILKNPNCSTAILTLYLKPVLDEYGLERVMVTTLQAISGAGLRGLPAMYMVDNLVPHISGEEWKIENESRKILGNLDGGKVKHLDLEITATATRVPVVDGHTEVVYTRLSRRPEGVEEVAKVLEEFKSAPQEWSLPTAPDKPLVVRRMEDRPQPRLDRLEGDGMSVVVGRLSLVDSRDGPWLRSVILGHNTIRGAAGAAILAYEVYKAYQDKGLL
ncbi:MAG: aspartate-semialdehyde dehydrogenase [Desulfurococcales archaeon]|nr:aspartate-semialdehyde dehydrogenase [Desulfurococcales archaeon]MCE4605230.1 aspartate-semialdehyde dehydrogenase [Desulfurococcales archaeon]